MTTSSPVISKPASWSGLLKGAVVIVGIGNPLRGDDGFGPAFVEVLRGRVRALLIDAGTAPESYAGKIVKAGPDTVVLVDAVHLGASAGAWMILEEDDIANVGFTTHDMSPRLLIDYLKNQTGARVILLGVQPQTLELGHEMSAPVQKTLEELADLFREHLHA